MFYGPVRQRDVDRYSTSFAAAGIQLICTRAEVQSVRLRARFVLVGRLGFACSDGVHENENVRGGGSGAVGRLI